MRDLEFQLRLRSRDHITYVRYAIRDYLSHCLGTQSIKMEMALNEAINNALYHGSSDGPVEILMFLLNHRRLICIVKNDGEGFAVHEKQQELEDYSFEDNVWGESGRGLMMMKAIADRVIHNARGNQIMLVKKLPKSS